VWVSAFLLTLSAMARAVPDGAIEAGYGLGVAERVREDGAIAWRCCAGLCTPALCAWRDRRHQHPGSADSEAVQSCSGWLSLHTVAADGSVRRANRGNQQPVERRICEMVLAPGGGNCILGARLTPLGQSQQCDKVNDVRESVFE
jgi:hypothetical protein